MMATMATDLHAIPREVWRRFVDGSGLDRVELMRYFRPLKTIQLDPVTAQEDADNQRQRFQRLIVELFPLDRVEAFIATHLEARTYPHIRAFDLNAGFMRLLENALAREAEPVQAPFDLEAERMGRYGKPRLDASEYRYAVKLLQWRPGLALATLFLRGFLVMWALALAEASRSSLNAEQAPSFGFFFSSWNQGSLVTALYPSIALHLRPRIELGGKRIDEPAFTRPLMSEVMSWLTAKGFFAHQATIESCGYKARLSCAATGILNQALGKRGWLNTIFDKVVEDQRIPIMSKYLERVVVRGNRLAAFADRARASGSAEWSCSLQIDERFNYGNALGSGREPNLRE
jgi:hypothetical protein